MNKGLGLLTAAFLLTVEAGSAAAESASDRRVGADRGDRIEAHLERRGDRVERRVERRGGRADRRRDRVGRHADRVIDARARLSAHPRRTG